MALYVNPVLSNRDYGIARIGGPGLANCMFFAARAAVLAKKLNARLMRPTWERFGIGQWIRKERDKRFYSGLFKGYSLCGGVKKAWLLHTQKLVPEKEAYSTSKGIIMVKGLRGYFSDLWQDAEYVRDYFSSNIKPEAIKEIPRKMGNVIAIHVRLGDYPEQFRTPLAWYSDAMETIDRVSGGDKYEYWVFSDGLDEELAPILSKCSAKRVYFGNAMADMVAMSRARLILGSDSTFSGWAAFLGNVPCAFHNLHYGRPLSENRLCVVSHSASDILRLMDKTSSI